jgi:phosphosulfolactate synthase (CoM biosynthesis protein A)
MKQEQDYILLKFGNIKEIIIHSKRGKQLVKQYNKTLKAGGLIMQDNTNEQKELICKIIDEANVERVYNDWANRSMSKERAKRYIIKYGSKK